MNLWRRWAIAGKSLVVLLYPSNTPTIACRLNKEVILTSCIFALKDKFHVGATLLSPMCPDEVSQPLDIGELTSTERCAVNTSGIVGANVAVSRDLRGRVV